MNDIIISFTDSYRNVSSQIFIKNHIVFSHYISDIENTSNSDAEIILREIFEQMYITVSDSGHEQWKNGLRFNSITYNDSNHQK